MTVPVPGSVPVPTIEAFTALTARVDEQDRRLHLLEATPPPPGPVPGPAPLTAVRRVNVGGPALTVDGVVWEADTGYTGGTTSDQGAGHYGAASVYDTERWGAAFSYELTGLPVGDAEVRLHLAENHPLTDQPGKRRFAVRVASVWPAGSVGTDVDIVERAGGQYTPTVVTLPTTVPRSGRLVVEFSGQVNAACVQGLEVLCYGTEAPTSPPQAPTGLWLSGAGTYDPYAFGDWRGRPVEVWETWNKYDTWERMRAVPSVYQYFTGDGAAPFDRRFPGRMSFSQPLWARRENAMVTARGDNAAQFREIARTLAGLGFGDAFIRLGWEQDGDWFWWHATDTNTVDWVAGFRRVYDIFKEVSANFTVVWNPNKSSNFGYDVRKSFPGGDYCDLVGVDLYDIYPPAHTSEQWEAQYMGRTPDGRPVGPGAWRAYAASVGKDICWPEWGKDLGSGDPATNSTDTVVYLREMRRMFAMAGPRTVYESYFNLQGPAWQLYPDTRFPTSAMYYRDNWRWRE